MDFMAHFTMGTGGHYITTLLADWLISTSHDPLPSSCHSKKMLWNLSIYNTLQRERLTQALLKSSLYYLHVWCWQTKCL